MSAKKYDQENPFPPAALIMPPNGAAGGERIEEGRKKRRRGLKEEEKNVQGIFLRGKFLLLCRGKRERAKGGAR